MSAAATPRPITADGRQPLEGRIAAFAVDLGAPAMLHLRLAAPHIARARPESGAEQITLNPRGGGLDVWLPSGKADVRLRGVAAAPLWGQVEITSTAAVTIGEGLGPAVLLAPGEARPFSFTVERAGPIGIGVRAEADRVEATVLDATGRLVGEGPVQMPTLEPGRFVLVLRLAADAQPVVARPALAGVAPPGDGPPDEVVRRYLELAGTPARRE